jgi:heme A synthase
MRAGPLLFRVTAIVVFLQLLLGGLLTFGFVSAAAHIILGFLVFILAIATMVVTFVSKPSFRPIQVMSTLLVVLILAQIILGFATLGTGSAAIAWIHFVNSLAIYGIAVSGAFMAMRWNHIDRTVATARDAPEGH